MDIRAILLGTIVILLIFDTESRKIGNSRGGSSRRSGGWGSRTRTTPRSRPQQTNQGGSTPNKIGWNVPDQKPSSNVGAKPSAPQEHISKTSATNVQSGYSPSGGYPRQPANNPSYPSNSANPSNPTGPHGHNPSIGQSYNPSLGHGYPTPAQGYNPSVGGYHPQQGYNPSVGQPYNPGFGQPSFGQPSFGQPSYGSPMGSVPQTVLVQSQPYKPGIGQLAKEAFVFAGVNAAVNRLLPGGIYGTRSSGGGSHTEITYNNYYNNGTAPNTDQAAPAAPVAPAAAPAATNAQPAAAPAAAPAADPNQPAPPVIPLQNSQTNTANNAAPTNSDGKTNNPQDGNQNNPNPLGYVISNDDIKKLSEDLFKKDKNNAYTYITVNLQGQKKDDSTTDDASEPLLSVKPEAYEIPTVKAVMSLHDNYELDVKTKETLTSEERKEESELLDKFLETDVLLSTMKFLAEKGYIPNDEYEFKDALRRIWFSQFKRIDGDASSSGFETVYLAEQFDSDIIGLHNWIYYAKQEADKKINYLGYIKEVKLGDKGEVLKVRSTLNGIVQPVTTIFVGTSPELEMALYTICFFTRPNNFCPVSLGGNEFMIVVNRVNYFGKDILVAAYPEI